MKHFAVTKIEKLYKDCEVYVNKRFNTARGRKIEYTIADVLYMMVTIFKNENTRDFLAAFLMLNYRLSNFYALNLWNCFMIGHTINL